MPVDEGGKKDVGIFRIQMLSHWPGDLVPVEGDTRIPELEGRKISSGFWQPDVT